MVAVSTCVGRSTRRMLLIDNHIQNDGYRLRPHVELSASLHAADAPDTEVRLGARRPHPRETPGGLPFSLTIENPVASHAYKTMAQPLESLDYLKARLSAQLGEAPEALSLSLAHAPAAELQGDTMDTLWELGLRPNTTLLVSVRSPAVKTTTSKRLPAGAFASAPQIVRSAAEASELVKRDGVCIFDLGMDRATFLCPGTCRERAAGLAKEVFGDAVEMVKPPVGVDDGATRGGSGTRPVDAPEHDDSSNYRGCAILKPHNDGANPYGDLFPDFLFMVCEKAAEAGGESYLIDGHAIVRAMPTEAQQLMMNTPLESRDFDRHWAERATWRSPMLVPVEGGSGRWRLRAEGSSAGDGADQPCVGCEEEGAQVLDGFAKAVRCAGAATARFKLHPGQALLLDNYRVLHAREPDNGQGQRLLWRSWIWTKHRVHSALPTNCFCLCHPLGRSAGAALNPPYSKERGCPSCAEAAGSGHCSPTSCIDQVATGGPNVDHSPWPGAWEVG